VTSVTRETASVVTITLDPPEWPGHRAGQHLDVRLTAEDGYTAERSYSIASAPGEPLAITVERLEGGEVSPYLTEELRAGDELELRGPIGGYFVWEPSDGGPVIDVFGTEMTAMNSSCGTCGTSRPVAGLVVYLQAPGTVVRCRTCGGVLMVFVHTV
jgi:ferredoxin-NADP reductase